MYNMFYLILIGSVFGCTTEVTVDHSEEPDCVIVTYHRFVRSDSHLKYTTACYHCCKYHHHELTTDDEYAE